MGEKRQSSTKGDFGVFKLDDQSHPKGKTSEEHTHVQTNLNHQFNGGGEESSQQVFNNILAVIKGKYTNNQNERLTSMR